MTNEKRIENLNYIQAVLEVLQVHHSNLIEGNKLVASNETCCTLLVSASKKINEIVSEGNKSEQ